MAFKLSADIAALAAKAAEIEDHVEAQSGGDWERRVPEAGLTVARFIEYIDMGKQKRRAFAGKEKKPADEVRVTFELVHPTKNVYEVEIDGVKTKRADRITLKLTKSMSEKARFKKLFDLMRRGREEITHMAQMLGEPFLVTVTHTVATNAAGKEVVYANLSREDGAFTIEEAVQRDALAGTVTAVAVPDPISDIRLFIWDLANKASWDSLYIEGTRVKELPDGTKQETSKNWLQEAIVGAENFAGSPLEELLQGGGALDALLEASANVEQEDAADSHDDNEPPFDADKKVEEAKPADKKPAAKATTPKATKPAPVADDGKNAALAALGL